MAAFTSRRLAQKIAIVTGGSSGIGRAIALAYAREGAQVIVADLEDRPSRAARPEATTLELIRQECNEQASFFKADVCSSSSVERLVSLAVQEHGRLDVLVNAAGIAPEIANAQPIWSVPDSTWDSTMAVNVTGMLNTCRAATAQMMAQPGLTGGDRGWIVNLSSIYGQTAKRGNVAYCASKHAVLGLTKAAALDCAPFNIRVNAICPGCEFDRYIKMPSKQPSDKALVTETALTASIASDTASRRQVELEQPLKGIGSAADVARMAVVLASSDADWVTGTAIAVDGGFLCQ